VREVLLEREVYCWNYCVWLARGCFCKMVDFSTNGVGLDAVDCLVGTGDEQREFLAVLAFSTTISPRRIERLRHMRWTLYFLHKVVGGRSEPASLKTSNLAYVSVLPFPYLLGVNRHNLISQPGYGLLV